jgi:hypothetical protein
MEIQDGLRNVFEDSDPFIKFVFSERDKLTKICDSVMLKNFSEVESDDLYFYFVEYKKRVLQENEAEVNCAG